MLVNEKLILFVLQCQCFVISEVNARDMVSGGALWELVRISRDCSREDIRALARRTLINSQLFSSELQRLQVEI